MFFMQNRGSSYFCQGQEVREKAYEAVHAKTANLTSDPWDEQMRKRHLSQLQDP